MKRTLGMTLVGGFAALALAACSSGSSDASGELSDEQRAEISAQVIEANNAMMATWAERGAHDEWLEFHLNGDHSSWVGDAIPFAINGAGSAVATGDDAKSGLVALFEPELANRSTAVDVSAESVAVLSPTTAVDVTEFTYVVTRDGGSSEPIPAVATSTWVLEDGEWKILQYHQSAPIPAEVSLERLGPAADPAWAEAVKSGS